MYALFKSNPTWTQFNMSFKFRCRALIFGLAVLCLSAGCNEQPHSTALEPPVDQALTVTTYHGKVKGRWTQTNEPIRVFQGVPYARPPVDQLRWRPPQAPQSWSGVLPTLTPGSACWQAAPVDNFVWSRGSFERSEDCLYLNIWGQPSAIDQAVMVWFHGGSHTTGRSHEAIFNGAELARQGVIVVTVNYRLGPLGFLAHPLLNAESSHNSSGNYGLLDKIAALNWIRDNIAQFGGNPGNMTIFGQSAGSQSVCALMASPLAKGLFAKAIGQSAACMRPLDELDPNGHNTGEALIASLTTAKQADTLRQISPQQLINAAQTTQWAGQSRIVVDGWVLPDEPQQIYALKQQAKVPLLLGSLANEGHNLFPLDTQLTETQLREFASYIAGPDLAEPLLALYASQANTSPGLAQREIITDRFMAHGMRRWADHQTDTGQPVYLYFMDHTPPAFALYRPADPELNLPKGPRSAGAYHSGDLAYVFGNTQKVGLHWQPQDHAMAALITQYWTNFAKTGDPNGPGLPNWPTYNKENRNTQLLRPNPETRSGVRREILDLWDQYAL